MDESQEVMNIFERQVQKYRRLMRWTILWFALVVFHAAYHLYLYISG